MGWAAALQIGASLLGNHAQNSGNKKAANTISNGANTANQFAQGQYAPYTGLGQSAVSGLTALNNGNYSGFNNSPDYLYARDQAQQRIERGAAARGSLYSGGTNVDLARALSGIASQNLGNYRNSLMGQANLGFNAASGLSNLFSQNTMTGAGAQANYQQQRGQNNSQMFGSLGNAFGSYLGGQSAGSGGMGFSPIDPGMPSPSFGQPAPWNGIWGG